MQRRLLQALGLLAATIAAAGCILFVNDDPSNLHATCQFQGNDSPCAKCVATSCAKPLADCCGDSVCLETALPLLSACEPGSSECGIALAGEPALASCASSVCAASCGGADKVTTFDDGGASTGDAGSTYCSQSGDSCECSVGKPGTISAANSMVCNTSTLKGPGLCCASFGWPNATDTSCDCEPFSCMPETGGDMFCGLSLDSTLTTSASGICCPGPTFCICGADENCESPISQCDVSTIGCSSGQVQVSSCSF